MVCDGVRWCAMACCTLDVPRAWHGSVVVLCCANKCTLPVQLATDTTAIVFSSLFLITKIVIALSMISILF